MPQTPSYQNRRKSVHRKKITAFVLCLALCLALAFSAAYIFTHANHHCCGENCPICNRILVCAKALAFIGTAVCIVPAFIFIMRLFVPLLSYANNAEHAFSLITLKVKLTC